MFDNVHNVVMAYYGQDIREADTRYPKEYGYIGQVDIHANNNRYEVHIRINRLKEADDMHLQVAFHDNQHGILAALYNTSFDECRLPSGKGTVAVKLEVPSLSGLSKGLVGVVLVRGSGKLPGSVIEDAWGWDNGKQVYFITENPRVTSAYLSLPIKWVPCI